MIDDIKAFREANGLTQMELADLIGVNQGTISRMENGILEIDKRTQLALQAIRIPRKRRT